MREPGSLVASGSARAGVGTESWPHSAGLEKGSRIKYSGETMPLSLEPGQFMMSADLERTALAGSALFFSHYSHCVAVPLLQVSLISAPR